MKTKSIKNFITLVSKKLGVMEKILTTSQCFLATSNVYFRIDYNDFHIYYRKIFVLTLIWVGFVKRACLISFYHCNKNGFCTNFTEFSNHTATNLNIRLRLEIFRASDSGDIHLPHSSDIIVPSASLFSTNLFASFVSIVLLYLHDVFFQDWNASLEPVIATSTSLTEQSVTFAIT